MGDLLPSKWKIWMQPSKIFYVRHELFAIIKNLLMIYIQYKIVSYMPLNVILLWYSVLFHHEEIKCFVKQWTWNVLYLHGLKHFFNLIIYLIWRANIMLLPVRSKSYALSSWCFIYSYYKQSYSHITQALQ